MKKTVLIVIVLAAISFGVGGFVWFYQNNNQTAPPPKKITIGILKSVILDGLISIAQEKGFFKKNGLEVVLKDYSLSETAIEALENKEIDVSVSADFAFANLSLESEKFSIISSIVRSDKLLYLVGLKSRGVATVANLKNKKVAIIKQSLTSNYFFYNFLIQNNLTLDDIQLVDVATTAQGVEALKRGEVDAAFIAQPLLYQLANELDGDNLSIYSLQPYESLYHLLIAERKFISDNKQIIDSLLSGLLEAEQFVAKNIQESQQIIAKEYNTSLDYIVFDWENFKFKVELSQDLIYLLENYTDWLIAKNKTGQRPPNYLNFIYSDSLRFLKPEAVFIK